MHVLSMLLKELILSMSMFLNFLQQCLIYILLEILLAFNLTENKDMDPVVQSNVSLTISLRHKFVKQIK